MCGSLIQVRTPEVGTIVGVSRSLLELGWTWPINGLRHQASNDASGWYVWTGELTTAADFFVPLHSEHLVDIVPELGAYLGLPPGSRFLLAPGYEDVWTDETLLDVDQQ